MSSQDPNAPSGSSTNAQTPISVQRLASLSDRGARGGGLKFKPKPTLARKSKAEREAQERAELAKQQEKERAATRATPRQFRAGGRGGRGGRGGFKINDNVVGGASGHLGGSLERVGVSGSRSHGSSGGRSGNFNEYKIEDSRSTAGPTVKIGKYEFDKDGVKRINLDQINEISDNEDEGVRPQTNGKGKEANSGDILRRMRPVRVPREEHIDRKVGVVDDLGPSSSTTRRSNAQNKNTATQSISDSVAEQVEITSTVSHARGASIEVVSDRKISKRGDRGTIIKTEPRDGDSMDIDALLKDNEIIGNIDDAAPVTTNERPPSSPTDAPTAVHNDQDQPLPARRNERSYRAIKPVSRPFFYQSKEDHEEWERKLRRKQDLFDLLVLDGHDIALHSDHADGEANDKHDIDDPKKGRCFLFQLPPLIPALREVSETVETTEMTEEVMNIDEDGNAVQLAPPFQTQLKVETALEVEDGASVVEKYPNSYSHDGWNDVSGEIGELIVYESGDATLTWGGLALDLSSIGNDSSLQEVIISDVAINTNLAIKPEDIAIKKEDGEPKVGVSMGQIHGMFVATPDWDSLFSD